MHLVLEPDGVKLYGVRRRRDVRVLTRHRLGARDEFKPGGFARLTDRPAWKLTDRVLSAAELFGADGERLAGDAGAGTSREAQLDVVRGFIRARRPAHEDPAEAEVRAATVGDPPH